jgi:hypothetical protein
MGTIVVPNGKGVVVVEVMAVPAVGVMVALGCVASAATSGGVTTVSEAIAPGTVAVAGCEISDSPGVGDGASPLAGPLTVAVGGYPTYIPVGGPGAVANGAGVTGTHPTVGTLPPDGPTSGGVGCGNCVPVDAPAVGEAVAGVGEGVAGVPPTWAVRACPLPVLSGWPISATTPDEVFTVAVPEPAGGGPVATPPWIVPGVAEGGWEGDDVVPPPACMVGEAAPANPPDDVPWPLLVPPI